VSTINGSVVGGGVALGAGVAGAVVGTTLLVSF